MNLRSINGLAAFVSLTLFLAACGGATYTIGGTVTGLAAGTQIVLNDNGGDALTVTANGTFTFNTSVPAKGSYVVTVATQPSGQHCTVANGTGDGIAADVTNVSVTCSTLSEAAYVVNQGDNTVSQYSVGTNGALAPLSTAIVVTGNLPNSITVDPTGRYAYVVNQGDSSVSQYTIGASGALVPMSPAFVLAGYQPASVSIDPMGRYA